MYGPRVSMALALSSAVTVDGQPVCVELTLRSAQAKKLSQLASIPASITSSQVSSSQSQSFSSSSLSSVAVHEWRWKATRRLHIAPKAKTFAPGNLRATADQADYSRLVQYWISNKYTLRYSGGLVPDIYHVLLKGEGYVFWLPWFSISLDRANRSN